MNQKYSLTTRILFAMVAGIITGIVMNTAFEWTTWDDQILTNGIFAVVGSIFVSALKMLVVPLVFISLIVGVISLKDINSLGRIGAKTLGLYMMTTAVAITIALSLASVVGPGEGMDLTAQQAEFQAKEAPPLSEVIINMVPSNPVAAMAEGNMLQIIVFAILLGLAMVMAGEKAEPVKKIVNSLNDVIMKMVEVVMWIAPYGVFALVAATFAKQGLDVIMPLISYFLVVVAALLIHWSVTYGAILRFIGKLNPIPFFIKIKEVMLFAFSMASSNATIPVTLNNVENKMGVKNSVASFTVPLGATINMDGTAIMQGVATIFIANVYGIDLTTTDLLLVVATATLASIGTAGVPGVGLIMLSMVLLQVGLPVEGIALIIGVDRLLDMMRTAVNVTGDAAVTCTVAVGEKALNHETFDDREKV